jgi:hypothetical protein
MTAACAGQGIDTNHYQNISSAVPRIYIYIGRHCVTKTEHPKCKVLVLCKNALTTPIKKRKTFHPLPRDHSPSTSRGLHWESTFSRS